MAVQIETKKSSNDFKDPLGWVLIISHSFSVILSLSLSLPLSLSLSLSLSLLEYMLFWLCLFILTFVKLNGSWIVKLGPELKKKKKKKKKKLSCPHLFALYCAKVK